VRRTQASILAAKSYDDFRGRLSAFDCRLCGLSSGRTHLVVDRGDPSAKLLFLGEAPGAEEDRIGSAFVGRSGKLLDSMLLEAGIDPESGLLIANVVKCRPPENRAPTKAEAHACFPFLEKQIELLKPKLIALLGATAAKHVLRSRPLKGLTQHVGCFFKDPAYPLKELMVLFHPAYILRNPRKRPEMVKHLKTLKRRLAT
jgi:DNA polymerase